MAQQAKKRRRKKHRGTQGGGIDTRGPRGRPRTREEARARARQKGGSKKKRPVDRRDIAPTWRSAFNRGAFGAVIFFLLFWLAFGRPVAGALALSGVMLAMYVPLGYYVDRFFFNRRLRQLQAQRASEREARRGGGQQ